MWIDFSWFYKLKVSAVCSHSNPKEKFCGAFSKATVRARRRIGIFLFHELSLVATSDKGYAPLTGGTSPVRALRLRCEHTFKH